MMVRLDDLPPIVLDETLARRPGVVDLWCFFCSDIADPALFAEYGALMTAEERAARDRYIFDKDRWLFSATRALVRTVLSAYHPTLPGAWRFGEGSHGKPHVVLPSPSPRLAFNLTNTPGLVVCAVTLAHERIGVDAEDVTRKGETTEIADRFFSPSEVEALRKQSPFDQRVRFFSYWTLKESYIKAKGLGLAIPLDHFSFELDRTPEITLSFDPRLDDDPHLWRFALLDASPRHMIAVGVDAAPAPLLLRAVSCVPLRGMTSFPTSLAP